MVRLDKCWQTRKEHFCEQRACGQTSPSQCKTLRYHEAAFPHPPGAYVMPRVRLSWFSTSFPTYIDNTVNNLAHNPCIA
jgi:hypothetical protein